MSRIIKALALSLLAVLALIPAVARAEGTSPGLFTAQVAANETATGIGEQIGVATFTISGLPSMTCTTAKGTGKALTTGPSFEKITVEAVGETCHIVFLGLTKPITITSNGCAAVFTAKTTGGGFSAEEESECPPGKAVEVHVYNNAAHTETLCTYEVPPQSHGTERELVNNTAATPDDVVAKGTVSGITVKNKKPGGFCGSSENMTATAKGEITIRATDEKGQFVNASVSG